MHDVEATERIALLTKAQAAAQAVIDEIEARNIAHPPSRDMRRAVLLQARGQERDLGKIIEDEEAASLVVTIDESDVEELTGLAAVLDEAIKKDALQTKGLETIRATLETIASVRDQLDA